MGGLKFASCAEVELRQMMGGGAQCHGGMQAAAKRQLGPVIKPVS